jgi:hypothetical protein
MTEPLPHGFDVMDRDAVRSAIYDALSHIPRRLWPSTAVVLRPEGIEVMRRAELANWFKQNRMHSMRKRVERTYVPPDRVLLWVEGDDDSELLIAKPPLWLAVDAFESEMPARRALAANSLLCVSAK